MGLRCNDRGLRLLLFGWQRWLSLVRSRHQNCNRRKYDQRRGNYRRHVAFGKERFNGFAGRDRERPGGFKTGLDVGEGAPVRGIGAQTLPRNGGEGLWNRLRHDRLPIGRSVPNRRALGQGLDQGDAERPDVGGR